MTPLATDYAWAAGIIDADGSIYLRKRYGHPKVYYMLFVVVGQSGIEKPKVIQRLQDLFSGTLDSPQQDARIGRLPKWSWHLHAAFAEEFLRQILPYLVGKQDQAEVAIEYREKAVGRGKCHLAEGYYYKLKSFKNYTRRKDGSTKAGLVLG